MKVLTFSRNFPSYHPKAGQPTDFVNKIWEGIWQGKLAPTSAMWQPCDLDKEDIVRLEQEFENYYQYLPRVKNYTPKFHTIRAGNRWKVGDWFCMKVWGTDVNPKSGRSGPYHSKQIVISPPMQVKKVWEIVIVPQDRLLVIDGLNYYPLAYDETIALLAENDGLSSEDLLEWFKKPLTGQIICWNESIEY